jgi:hypothetical protein
MANNSSERSSIPADTLSKPDGKKRAPKLFALLAVAVTALTGVACSSQVEATPTPVAVPAPTEQLTVEPTPSPELAPILEVPLKERFEWSDAGAKVTIVSTAKTLPLEIEITISTMDGDHVTSTQWVAAEKLALSPSAPLTDYISADSLEFIAANPIEVEASHDGIIGDALYINVEDLNPTGQKREIKVTFRVTTSQSAAQLDESMEDSQNAQTLQGELDKTFGQSTSTYSSDSSVIVGGKSQ